MKLFTVLKIILNILDNVSESSFVLQFYKATKRLGTMGVLCILGDQYIIGSDLSRSVIFSLNFLQ